MKKIYAILMMVLMAVSTNAALADWFLNTYDANNNYASAGSGQFVTTETDGMFLLEGVEITAEGVNFCINNESWSEVYGWSDEGGSVDATDKAVKLATATGATGWLALPAGKYDVMWDANNLTVTFKISAATGSNADWYIYFYSEENSINGDAGQFRTTENDGVFVLDGCDVTAKGISFCIHNADWTARYGWTETASATVTETGVDVPVGLTDGNGWLDLEAGKYTVTWDVNNLTIRFDGNTSTIVSLLHHVVNGDNATYNLAGQRVSAGVKGIVIRNGKKFMIR